MIRQTNIGHTNIGHTNNDFGKYWRYIMTRTYEDYLNEPFCIPLEECQMLHKEMLNEIRNDEDASEYTTN